MKRAAASTLRSVASTSRSTKLPVQAFSSSSCCSEQAQSAESSKRVDRRARVTGESVEEAFKRNLKDVQQFRRARESLRVKVPFIPPNTQTPKSQPTPIRAALSTLLATGAALGCSSSKLNPTFAQFVYANRAGLSIIDLDQSLPILRRTAALIRDVVKEDGVVLFVGTKPGQQKCLEKAKERLGDNGYISNKWMPGLLTNAETLFGLQPLLDRSNLPDLVVFLNPREVAHGVRECTLRNIPTVGVIDSDTDPRFVTYPIPANVQSLRTSELIVGTLSMAGQEGRRLRLKDEEQRSKREIQRRGEEAEDRRRR